MEAIASVKYVRISPRKVKVVMDLIRNKPVGEAMAILLHTRKAACEYIIKLLKSATANAVHKADTENETLDESKLYVSQCFVCPGPTLKRMMPRAQGRGDRILKRTSHMTIIVKEKEE